MKEANQEIDLSNNQIVLTGKVMVKYLCFVYLVKIYQLVFVMSL